MNRSWLIALIPLVLGLVMGVLFGTGILPNPILYIRADLAALSQIIGLLIAVLIWGWFVFKDWLLSSHKQIETRAGEERRRFLQRLDHELKNPLTAIQAGLANLQDREEDQQALFSVKTQTGRLSRLVSDLRKLADLEKRNIERDPVDVGEILETLVSLAEANELSKGKNLNLVIPQAPWPLPAVSGDYDLIMLALHNLLDNALKFSRAGDTIEIRAFEDDQAVVVEIADTGPGVPSEELPHLWEELYRGKGARAVPGSGLGLALVRAIIERHGGEVHVRSREGQGTVINVRMKI